MPFQPRDDVFTHHTPHLIVVGSYVGRIFVRVGLAFEHDHGQALVVGAVDGGRDGGHLVGGHDEQVDALVHQAVYLLYLALVVVVSGGEA